MIRVSGTVEIVGVRKDGITVRWTDPDGRRLRDTIYMNDHALTEAAIGETIRFEGVMVNRFISHPDGNIPAPGMKATRLVRIRELTEKESA
jgi:hypothetical protein